MGEWLVYLAICRACAELSFARFLCDLATPYTLVFESTARTWQDAHDSCIERGGHFPAIHSAWRNQQVRDFADANGATRIWIGAHDLTDEVSASDVMCDVDEPDHVVMR